MKKLTILIPVLNEEETIKICIEKAKTFLMTNNIDGEILVVDNGSTDDSVKIAKECGARVEIVNKRGYGNALRKGSEVAKGKYTIMGDADDSYNFLEIKPILDKLENGVDFVIGNRYLGIMQKGAMKFLHKYIGTPFISFLVRWKYKIKVGDVNCGLRGYKTSLLNNLKCKAEGMEYATEMIIKAQKQGLKISEVPINFYKDKRRNRSHLRTIKDGIRHIRLILETSI